MKKNITNYAKEKENVNLFSQSRLCSFVLAQFEINLLGASLEQQLFYLGLNSINFSCPPLKLRSSIEQVFYLLEMPLVKFSGSSQYSDSPYL